MGSKLLCIELLTNILTANIIQGMHLHTEHKNRFDFKVFYNQNLNQFFLVDIKKWS